MIDAFLPIVYTEDPVMVGARHLVAAGQVMDEGGSTGVSVRDSWSVPLPRQNWKIPEPSG